MCVRHKLIWNRMTIWKMIALYGLLHQLLADLRRHLAQLRDVVLWEVALREPRDIGLDADEIPELLAPPYELLS